VHRQLGVVEQERDEALAHGVEVEDAAWIECVGHLSSNGETFRIAFEDFGSYGADDTYNTLGGDVAVPVIEELTVTMSNGARYNARDTGGIIVAD
jgi:hypothetical protein